MNKIKKLFVILCLFSVFIPMVNAECDYETQVKLRAQANNVKATYEMVMRGTGEFEEGEYIDENGTQEIYELEDPAIEVSVYNIIEELYVTIKNLNTNVTTVYYYEDTNNGTISWDITDFSEIIEYEIKVYSTLSDCNDIELNNISLVVPKYNEHSWQPYCYGVDEYYCDEWITQEINMSDDLVEKSGYEYQQKKAEEVQEEEPQTEDESFWEKYGLYVEIGIILLIGVAAGVVIVIKRRRRVL